jgi:hypothetical protein
MGREPVGEFKKNVIDALGLSIIPGTLIYIGETNKRHMKETHPTDYKKYGSRLRRIIDEPDYVGLHNDGSVEYIKCWGRYMKVAVRVAGDGEFYARSLYHIKPKPSEEFIKMGRWKALTKTD